MRKKILIALPIILVLFISGVLFLYWHTNIVSGILQDVINMNTGDAVRIEYSRLEGDLFRNIHIQDLNVQFANGTHLHSNELTVRYSLWATVKNRFLFDSIVFDTMYVQVSGSDTTQPDSVSGPDTTNFGETVEQVVGQMESLFSNLPEISVGELKVRSGFFHLEDPEMTIDSIYIELNASVNQQEISLNLEEVYGRWREKQFDLQNLHASIIGRGNRLTLNQVQVKTAASHIYANGELSMEEEVRLILSLEDILLDYPDLKKLFDVQGFDSGFVHFSTVVIGSPTNFATQVNMTGQYNTFRIDTLIIDADYEDGDIIIRDSRINTLESDLSLRGRIAENRNDLLLRFSKFNIDHFLADTFQTNLTGYLRLKMDQLNFKDITGSGEIMLIDSEIDSLSFDSLRFELTAQNNNFEIIEPSFLLLGPDARFSVTGNLNSQREIDLHLVTENSSLQSVAESTQMDSMYGYFDGNVFLTGYLFDPNFEGYLWVPTLRQNDLGLDSLMAQVRIDKLLSKRSGVSYLYASKGYFGTLGFSQLRVDLTSDSNTVYLDTLLLNQEENYFASTGFLEYGEQGVDIELDFLRIFYGDYWIENDGTLILRSNPDELLIEHALFSAPQGGLIELRGFWELQTDEMQFGVQLTNIETDPFSQFLPPEFEVSGNIEGDFELLNPHREPELSIELGGSGLVFNRVPIGSISAAFDFYDNRIYVSEFTLADGSSRINLDGDIALQLSTKTKKQVSFLEETFADLILSWNDFELLKIAPALQMDRPLYGQISGQIRIAGSLRDPRGIIEVKAPRIVYDKLTVDDLALQVRFNQDSLILENAYTELNGTSITAHGWQLADLNLSESIPDLSGQPLEITISSKDDQMQFLGYFLDQVEQIRGEYDARFTLTGTPQNMRLENGYFKLDDGQLELSRVKNIVSQLNVDATIENSVMTFRTLSAVSVKEKDFWEKSYAFIERVFRLFQGRTAPEGILTGSGTIDFKDLYHPVLDLQLDMRKFYVDYFVENTRLSISANDLKISGRDTISIAGSINLPFGDYTPDLDKLRKNIYLSSVSPTSTRTIAWNLEITIPGNFFISSSPLDLTNNFQLEIMGDLRSIQEPANPNMELSGVTTILSGKYGSWGQDFQVESGTINFTTPKVINPTIDIQAERQSRGYIFELGINGNLDNQQLSLQVRDEQGQYLDISMFDKLTLLSLGTTADRLSASDIAVAGEDVINTSVETALSRGAESITGLDRVELTLEDRFVDLQSFRLNNGLKDASVSFGKYLSSNLYLEYKSQFGGGVIPAPKLSWQPGNQIGLEYRINRNWSVDSYYSQTKRGNNLMQISLSWRTTF